MKHSINVWALAVAAGLLVACTEKVTDDSVPVGGVSVEPSSLTLEIGQTSVLRASVLPSDADEQGVTWTSSDESVAVVDVDGTVTALAAGSAVVTATTVDGGYTDDCSVTVNEAVTEPEFVDLGSAGTANCYVVTGPGNYKFDATVMGNGASTEGITPEALSPASAALVWQTRSGMVTSVELDDESYVNFVLDGAEGGNALIAAYDADGNIVWSWHIWYPEEAVSSVRVADSFDVMNMNLGALSMGTLPLENADCYGLLYQWGRKDPFPASATLTGDETTVGAPLYDASGNSVTIEYSSWSNLDDNTLGYATAHPTCVLSNYAHFSTSRDWLAESNDALWGNPHGRDLEDGEHVNLGEKSIYDPCPVGWRVPPADVFRSFTETGQVSWIPDEFNVVDLNADGVITSDDFSYGWTFIANESESLFFPAAGRYDGSYAMLMGSVSGLWGSYWSNSPGSEDYGYTGMGSSPLSFQATMISPMASASRADAYSVRCVRE